MCHWVKWKNLKHSLQRFGKMKINDYVCMCLFQLGGLWRSTVHREHVRAGGGRLSQHRGHGLPVLRFYHPLHTHLWTCEYSVCVYIEKNMKMYICALWLWIWEYHWFKLSPLSRLRLCPPSSCSVRSAAEVAGWCYVMELWICCRRAWTHAYAPWWWREECRSPFLNFYWYIYVNFKGAL